MILGRTSPLSVEYNDFLFTRLFLLIHLQSVIHLFNIPSNPINWPCLVRPSVYLALLFSSYERMRQMCMYSRGRDEMVLCFLEELVTFTHIGLCVTVRSPNSIQPIEHQINVAKFSLQGFAVISFVFSVGCSAHWCT